MVFHLGYLVPEFPGQTHAFFWREIEALRSLGVNVHIVSTKKPSPLICQHDFASAALSETKYVFPPRLFHLAAWAMRGCQGLSGAHTYVNGLDEPPTSLHRLGLIVAAVDLLRWAQKMGIDHIHGHSCANSAHLLALAHMMGGPTYSLTLHGDLDVYGADYKSKMRGAKFVSAVGKHLVEQILQNAGISKHRVFSTFMGVRTAMFKAAADTRVYNMASGGMHVVTVARLHQNKGHFHALSALRHAKDRGLNVHYTMAGEGPFRQEITCRIKELGLEAETTLLGTVSEKDVLRLLTSAHALVLPSVGIGEAWPVSVMEAMSAGLPVIASIIGATSEMIVDGRDGFLVPQGEDQVLFERMEALYNDCELRRKIGVEARRTASRRFDVATTAKVLIDAIRKPDTEKATNLKAAASKWL